MWGLNNMTTLMRSQTVTNNENQSIQSRKVQASKTVGPQRAALSDISNRPIATNVSSLKPTTATQKKVVKIEPAPASSTLGKRPIDASALIDLKSDLSPKGLKKMRMTPSPVTSVDGFSFSDSMAVSPAVRDTSKHYQSQPVIPPSSSTISIPAPPPGLATQPRSAPVAIVPPQGLTAWKDIDAPTRNIPEHVSEYVAEIYTYLRDVEARYLPQIDLREAQREICPQMRAILVDWLIEVAEEYKLSGETLFLTINYLDRYLALAPVSKNKLQLVGIVCMFIASKFEEIHSPKLEDFVFIADNTYQANEMIMMERKILHTLSFNLAGATVRNFIKRFLKAAEADATATCLAYYLSELTLVDSDMTRYLPSVIAAAAVCLALLTLRLPDWTPTIEHYTELKVTEPHFQACLRRLYFLYTSAGTSTHQAVQEKYSAADYLSVSKIPAPHFS